MVGIVKTTGIDTSRVQAQSIEQLQGSAPLQVASTTPTVDAATIEGLRSALDISVKNTVAFILMSSSGPLADRLQQASPKEREAMIDSIAQTLQTQSVDAVMNLIRDIRA